LYWSTLLGLLLVAYGLSRVKLTPLTMTQWFLLAIGLSQVPIAFAAVVVAWLLALGLRGHNGHDLTGWRFNFMQTGLGVLTIAALLVLLEAIRHGLLGVPDMQVSGNGSGAHHLSWYADRVDAVPPVASVWSLSIWVYRLLMLAWALWLALAVIKWLQWGWTCCGRGGLWRPWRRTRSGSSA
jgi:hypothetical protein